MVTQKEAILLRHLRQNARESLTKISKKTSIPVSTLCDMLKRLESGAIIKHTSLIDFSKIGHNLKVRFTISLNEKNQKHKLKEFLINSNRVNSLYSLINGQDFHAECIFKDLKEVSEFKEELEKFEIKKIEEHFIIEELKKEEFSL